MFADHLLQVAVILRDSRCCGLIEMITRLGILAWQVLDVILVHRIVTGHQCDSKFSCAA